MVLSRERVIDAIVRMLSEQNDGTVASKHGALCEFRVAALGDGRFAKRDEVTLERTDTTLTRDEVPGNLRSELQRADDGFLCMAYAGLADKRLRAWQMLALIVATGALTFLLNPAAGKIAIASSVAFTAAAMVDWATFARLRGSWLIRANGSNLAGAAVDSIIFPTLAFGALVPGIVAMQFVAKVAGGALWAWALSRVGRPATA